MYWRVLVDYQPCCPSWTKSRKPCEYWLWGLLHLEPLVDGELYQGEGDFAHDRGEVARVEPSQAAALEDCGHRLASRCVQAGLHLLLHVFGGYSNQTRHLG